MKAKLDIAGVESLPQLVVHSSFLEMAFQGLVIPAEDLRVTTVELARFVVDLADAYPDVEEHACEADLQEDVSSCKRRVLAVHGANATPSGHRIAVDQRLLKFCLCRMTCVYHREALGNQLSVLDFS